MIIAERALQIRTKNSMKEMKIQFYLPINEENAWKCRYDIAWPDQNIARDAFGSDSVQAILIAMQMAGADLYFSAAHRENRLFLDGNNGAYGLPVPPLVKNKIIGYEEP